MQAKHPKNRHSSQALGQAFDLQLSSEAQPITLPGSSFSSLLSACFACIAFLHPR